MQKLQKMNLYKKLLLVPNKINKKVKIHTKIYSCLKICHITLGYTRKHTVNKITHIKTKLDNTIDFLQ